MSAPQAAAEGGGGNDQPVDPLLDALPPATDYISYATIVEQYLSRDNVTVLERVLQDEKLAINIGWDLVHLLLPLLPDSYGCLMTIARQGNPREVLLKATESLRLLDIDHDDDEDDHDEQSADDTPLNTLGDNAEDNDQQLHNHKMVVQQFTVLLSMLSLLHARIKTKFPSRFLSTTLSATLATLSKSPQHAEVLMPKLVHFVSTLHGLTGPALPPRQASASNSQSAIASDPEAQPEAPSDQDKQISRKLLQAYVTDICEVYVSAFVPLAEVPGLGLADRCQERLVPSTILPRRATVSEKFHVNKHLQHREEIIKTLCRLATSLGFGTEALIEYVAGGGPASAAPSGGNDEDDFPESPEDVTRSRIGAAAIVAFDLFDIAVLKRNQTPQMSIFPQHLNILRNIGGFGGAQEVSFLPESVLDALLAIGVIILSQNNIGSPDSDEQFNEYLHFTSLISANCPVPSLRFHAHYITSTVLRSHPDENARLAFIKDTLEHCPFENVKTTAVTWIKGEILEANPPDAVEITEPSIFATPVGLDAVAEHLFPDLSIDLRLSNSEEAWTLLRINLSFYLASLNFYYLLLSAKHLHRRLAIKTLHTGHDIGGCFLGPLKAASQKFDDSLAGGHLRDIEGQAGAEASRAELMILNDVLERIDQAVLALNQE